MLLLELGRGSFLSGTIFKGINLIVSQIALGNTQLTCTLPTHQQAKKLPKIENYLHWCIYHLQTIFVLFGSSL